MVEQNNQKKPEWFYVTHWDIGTLTIILPSWKFYPQDLYTNDYILTLRMRDDPFHMVMFDNRIVLMLA